MLFQDDILSLLPLKNETVAGIIHTAIDRAAGKIQPSDFLAAAIASNVPIILVTLGQALKLGVSPQDLLEIIEVYHPPRSTPSDFDGRREGFSPMALAALDRYDAELASVGDTGADAALHLLLSAVLDHLSQEELDFLAVLDAHKAASLFRDLAREGDKVLEPLFEVGSGRLRGEEFTGDAWSVLESAARRAADLGYDRLLPPHLFLALLAETEGITEHLVRLQAPVELGLARLMELVADALRLADRRGLPLELRQNDMGESLVEMLRGAQKIASFWGGEQIDTAHLLGALLETMPPRLAAVLTGPPLRLNLTKMREQLDQELLASRSRGRRDQAFRLPANLLPSEDLTYQARTDGYPKALHLDAYVERLCRALSRQEHNHVLIIGPRGVGKTTLIRELARRAAVGELPFLQRRRLLRVACRDVAPEESRGKLDSIIAFVAGRTDVILCLDDLGPLLRAESGGNNKLPLRRALKEGQIRLLGSLSPWDFEDLLASDYEMLELFNLVRMEEPQEKAALDMVAQAATLLEQKYRLTIDQRAMERAVVLSANYILNERLPSKAIKVLARACEDLRYALDQQPDRPPVVTAAAVIDIVADISGIPVSSLSGIGAEVDYRQDFAREIFGQPEAVKTVAEQLELIKAGATDPTKPAAVMFFAGLTGVGKTELAKVLAKVYSASKRLQTYTMGNFTQDHTISGIIGVPPGYVGHEQGGRLINDLNADPYAVFLLDEAEKAHPDIWKPFLNLFDEAWIVDTRGVKAFADKAIFILTSNAGHEIITQMSGDGRPMEEIIAAVKQHLSTIRHPRTQEVVFPPEFLARIGNLLVFQPLDQAAMMDICRKLANQIQESWLKKKEKTLIIPDALLNYLGRQAALLNDRSGGKEGGRIVRKLLQEMVEVPLQREIRRRKEEFRTCQRIELHFLPPPQQTSPYEPQMAAQVQVSFLSSSAPPAEILATILADLHQTTGAGSLEICRQVVCNCCNRWQQVLGSPAEITAEPAPAWHQDLATDFHSASEELEKLAHETGRSAAAILQQLTTTVERLLREAQT